VESLVVVAGRLLYGRRVEEEVVCSMADGLRRRSSALWQTGCRGGRPLCGRRVEEVVRSVADGLRRSSALWQTGGGG
jgi:hypothetical protein